MNTPNKTTCRTELLLPAGSVESFRAALEGGADAVYLGLKQFNARGRASNFTNAQFLGLLEEARLKKVLVYVTLNTVIKNNEIADLLQTLWFLSKTRVGAVIIQDWGVYYLAKTYFPNLVLHASTQMGNHNSLGTRFSKKMGIERVILARELTKDELKTIAQESPVEIEYFVHGALCYSFSGMCLFSSFMGGSGANRGLCAQSCRRAYQTDKQEFLFSLKDNQLVDEVQFLKQIGISSIKIEGRMKSAEYVYTTAQAYRMALDSAHSTEQAKLLLADDTGREKTAYFFGGNVAEAITENPNNGLLLGKITQINPQFIEFNSDKELNVGLRLRLVSKSTQAQYHYRIETLEPIAKGYRIAFSNSFLQNGDSVFLVGGHVEQSFSSKIKTVSPNQGNFSNAQKVQILSSLKPKNSSKDAQLWVRIQDLEWFKTSAVKQAHHIVLHLSKSVLENIQNHASVWKAFSSKIWLELPKFIPESQVEFYKLTVKNLQKYGINQLILSHLSQQLLLAEHQRFSTNENVYVFNDAASKFIEKQGAKWFFYPLEMDFETFYSLKNRNGIVTIYSHPELFYSRMPVLLSRQNSRFMDAEKSVFVKSVDSGMTVVRPEKAVSWFKYQSKFEKLGYRKFLIDLSGVEPKPDTWNRLFNAFKNQEVIEPSNAFNLRRTLK